MEAYKTTNGDKAAARKLGIAHSTFVAWRNRIGLPNMYRKKGNFANGDQGQTTIPTKTKMGTRRVLATGQTGMKFFQVECFNCDAALEFAATDTGARDEMARLDWTQVATTQYCPGCMDSSLPHTETPTCRWLNDAIEKRKTDTRKGLPCPKCGSRKTGPRGHKRTYYGTAPNIVCQDCRTARYARGHLFMSGKHYMFRDIPLMVHVWALKAEGFKDHQLIRHLKVYHNIGITHPSIKAFVAHMESVAPDSQAKLISQANRIGSMLKEKRSRVELDKAEAELLEIEAMLEAAARRVDADLAQREKREFYRGREGRGF